MLSFPLSICVLKGIMDSRACARWGAKRQLNFSELRDLTDLIFKLQLLAVEIANVMCANCGVWGCFFFVIFLFV